MPVRSHSEGVLQQTECVRSTVERNENDTALPSQADKISTYSVLHDFVLSYESTKGDIGEITNKALDDLLLWMDDNNYDLSSHSDFPNSYSGNDIDVDKTITLMARLQNKVILIGETHDEAPTLADITEFCLASRKDKPSRYKIGAWVEVRGENMDWTLGRIIDYLKLNEENEETVYYMTAIHHRLSEASVRIPKEALLNVFGVSPWIWQQWACLRVEHILRFQHGHMNDFETFNIQGYVDELWKLWMHHPKNKDFAALFARVGEFGQEELIKHVMDPFNLMQDAISNSNGKWDIQDADLSVYTYLSVLGSGFTEAFVIFFLQVSMPSVLYIYYASVAKEDDGDGSLLRGTRLMLFLTLLYYFFKTTRDLNSNFRRVVCGTDSAHSRILRMRTKIWETGNDNLPQSVGFVFDLFMNSGYVCMLYIYNMFILFNTSDAFNILSSIVVFEILFNLDEEIAAANWWDEGGRWIKAGIVEMILQLTIRREFNHSWDLYLTHFSGSLTQSERKKVQERFQAAGFTEETFLVGSESHDTINLLTTGERIEQKRWQEAVGKGVVKSPQLEKRDIYFGGILTYGISAVFQKHQNYRAWIQWETLLFLFPVPTLVPDRYVAGSKLELHSELSGRSIDMAVKKLPSVSFNKKFWSQVANVLTLKDAKRDLQAASNFDSSRKRKALATRFLHGILSWSAYGVQLLFPFITLIAICSVFTDAYCKVHFGFLALEVCTESE